jgi:hypothetical protein
MGTPEEAGNAATRKGSPPIKVYCLPSERQVIEQQARSTGLSMACYLRRVGMGYQVKGILDHQMVGELMRVNGDLGRLGGLLKLWLSGDQRAAGLSDATIRAVLWKIEATQGELQDIAKAVVRPRAKP